MLCPTVIANELVGVQPTTGPGRNPTLRVRYSDTLDDVTAGEEAHSPFKIGVGYSGGGSTDKADATATLEGTAGKRLSIPDSKADSSSKTRKLSPAGLLKRPSKTHKHNKALTSKQK